MSKGSDAPGEVGEYDGEVGEYCGEVGEYCGEAGLTSGDSLGDVGLYAGLVGLYAGLAGLYCGDVGEYAAARAHAAPDQHHVMKQRSLTDTASRATRTPQRQGMHRSACMCRVSKIGRREADDVSVHNRPWTHATYIGGSMQKDPITTLYNRRQEVFLEN